MQHSVSRKKFIKDATIATAALATGMSSGSVLAADHSHHHATSHHHSATDPKLQAIAAQALDCVQKGETCTQHCFDLFKQGDTSVAQCADSVQEMLAMCQALSKMALHKSKHVKALMEVCIQVCADCEKECRKHAAHHAECKACADSCKECIALCKAYLA